MLEGGDKMGTVAHDYIDFRFLGEERPDFKTGSTVSVMMVRIPPIKNYAIEVSSEVQEPEIKELRLEVEGIVDHDGLKTVFCNTTFEDKLYDAAVYLNSSDLSIDFIRLSENLPLVKPPLFKQ